MVKLYYFEPSPPCRAVRLLAKELGIDLELKAVNLMEKEHLKPEFEAVNPEHTLPTLDDDGFIMWESQAILQYLANKYGSDDKLYPNDPQKRAVIDQRLMFDKGTLFQRMLDYVYPVIFEGQDYFCAKRRVKLEQAVSFLDQYIGKSGGWVAGQTKTIADYSIAATFANYEQLKGPHAVDLSKFQNIKSWLEKCRSQMTDFDELVTKSSNMWGQLVNSKAEGLQIK